MRLICPNCDAQYEVDSKQIPRSGREVQCSNCGHGWFQERDVTDDAAGSEGHGSDEERAAARAAARERAERARARARGDEVSGPDPSIAQATQAAAARSPEAVDADMAAVMRALSSAEPPETSKPDLENEITAPDAPILDSEQDADSDAPSWADDPSNPAPEDAGEDNVKDTASDETDAILAALAEVQKKDADISETGDDLNTSSDAPADDAAPDDQPDGDPDTDEDLNAVSEGLGTSSPERLPPRRRPAPEVMDILRNEARRERDARRAEEQAQVDDQPELDIGDPPKRDPLEPAEVEPRDRDGPPFEDETEDDRIAAASALSGRGARGKDLLPDIEAIKSSLAPDGEADTADDDPLDTPNMSSAAAKGGRGTQRGFAVVIILAALGVAGYAQAPVLSETVPALAPALESYVDWVNGLRLWLDRTSRDLVQAAINALGG